MKKPLNFGEVTQYLETLVEDPLALRGQQLRGGGPVRDFELELSILSGFPHCVATCNATTSLMGIGLMLSKKYSEVLVPSDHWAGTASAFRALGYKVESYDGEVLPLCKKGGRGILITGTIDARPAGYDDWVWVEDSTRMAGWTHEKCSMADLLVLSFGPGKPLSLGEGGAILCRKDGYYEDLVRLTQHPERYASENGEEAKMEKVCINGRMHPVSALLGWMALRSRQV